MSPWETMWQQPLPEALCFRHVRVSVCTSRSRVRNAWREINYTWHKCPLDLDDELILVVKGHYDLTKVFRAITQEFIMLIMTKFH